MSTAAPTDPSPAAGPVVDTTLGPVRGTADGDVTVFRGVPYAAAPVGELRFRAPQPRAPWRDVRDCATDGPTPPQHATPLTQHLPPQGDDCLHVTVWTPGCDDAGRPVMVWIHGGGFTSMAASDPGWSGRRLAERGDVVVVGVEYRQGALGFLHLAEIFGDDYAGSGANGLLDQVAALEWVRDNVAAFGGDPTQVTVFGESAGAMSISTLLTMPAAQGLFARAVPQSGAANAVLDHATATRVAEHFLRHAGVAHGDLAALHAMTPQAVLDAQAAMAVDAMGELKATGIASGLPMVFQPVVDGAVVPTHPFDAIAAGDAAAVPLLIGTTRDEMRLFSELMQAPMPSDDAAVTRMLGRMFGDAVDPATVLGTYRAAHPDLDARLLAVSIITDIAFRIPALRMAEAHARHQPDVWLWRLDWESPLFPDNRLGACHALDLPFVFDMTGTPLAALAGAEPPRHLVDAMQESWLAFARGDAPASEELPDWPRVDPSTRPVMVFDVPSRVVHHVDPDTTALWDGVI